MMRPRNTGRCSGVVAWLALAASAAGQATQSADARMDFGADGLSFPPAVTVNAHVARTATLLGEAYRRGEPLVWKRVQYVADLGQVALPAAAPYLVDAMKDAAPAVRAEAVRSAARVGELSLLPETEKLFADADPTVRRQAVLAAADLARTHQQSTTAIERGLGDRQPQVVAAAIQAAWLPSHAPLIAQKLPTLPQEMKPAAALALGRLKAAAQAAAVLPLLDGDVPQRAAAVRALADMGDPAQAPAVRRNLTDPHPTVRREALVATGKLGEASARHAISIRMLQDPDPTVRQAAAGVLTPDPSAEALAALLAQLGEDYAPLHEAARQALVHPRDPLIREATIRAAVDLLGDANPRRREDASYLLGRLGSNGAVDRHVELLRWDSANPAKTDWPLVAQAAESLGLIGDARAAELLMTLIKPAPDAVAPLAGAQRNAMATATANALVAAARLRHRPALAEAVRILQIDAAECPGALHTAAAFAVGVLADQGSTPPGVNFLSIYESVYETRATKFEALKALGNLRHAPSAERLTTITSMEPGPDLRWIAHWAYERCSGTTVPYTPPSQRREPPVSISDLTR